MTREAVFTEIYSTNFWGSQESFSGSGSELQHTDTMRSNLPAIIEQYDIKSIFDAGCGDWNWLRHVDIDIEYTGADIVKSLVDDLTQKYQKSNVRFIHTDVVENKFARHDLVIARDILFHLSYRDIKMFLDNFLESESKFLLTTHSGEHENIDIESGSWRFINLFDAPFCFAPPIYTFDDVKGRQKMCLFKRDDLAVETIKI